MHQNRQTIKVSNAKAVASQVQQMFHYGSEGLISHVVRDGRSF